ncbi:MAG: bifunctional precorrin-2 dehydrogenase/sirohydrochlorin ferrochelatase [Nitrospirota bacterium]
MKLDSSKPAPFYYPIFLNLRDKQVVVCGGGRVAERKILSLLKTGARITVISPEITKRIERENAKGNIRLIRRRYRKGDLKGAFVVIVATDSPFLNERISRHASCLVNVVDTPGLCNFIVPSFVNRSPFLISISTSGISPALSRSVRKELGKLYGPEISSYLKLLKKYRIQALELIRDRKRRRKFLQDVASENMLKILREKGLREAKYAVDNLFSAARAGM